MLRAAIFISLDDTGAGRDGGSGGLFVGADGRLKPLQAAFDGPHRGRLRGSGGKVDMGISQVASGGAHLGKHVVVSVDSADQKIADIIRRSVSHDFRAFAIDNRMSKDFGASVFPPKKHIVGFPRHMCGFGHLRCSLFDERIGAGRAALWGGHCHVANSLTIGKMPLGKEFHMWNECGAATRCNSGAGD